MTSQHVIRSYLIIAGLHTLASSLIWGVNTLFLLGAGLTIGEVFIANAFFTVGMAFFEVPTGLLADTRGRRASFLLSAVVLFLATVGYVWVSWVGGGVVEFSLMSIVLGLGFTFYSGAVEAWLVDALTATEYTGELDHVFARGAMVTGFTMLVGTVGGGVIGSADLALPYIGRAVLLVLVFIVAFFTMHDLGFEPRALRLSAIPMEMGRLARASVRFGWQEPQLRLLMAAGFIHSGFIVWAFYAWQPYFLELFGDPSAVWVAGIVAALISISMIVGNWLVDRLTQFCGKRTTLILPGIAVFSIMMIGVGLTESFWAAVIMLLIAMGATGVMQPVRQSYIHRVVSSQQRATVISVDAMIGSAGGIVSQTGLGQLSQGVGIAPGYIIGGALSLLGLPLIYALRRRNGEADVIVGVARRKGPCAGQGLPEIATVDPKVRREVTANPGD